MGDGSRRTEQLLQSSRRWKGIQTSPERNRLWTEPASDAKRMKRVSVVYYLSRNGHLEHPHFMEVPLSCPDGLYLKDVISRLNLLRGKGMASMYSWSSKRSYKTGFVWHDLSEDDYIHPVHGLDYVLKGSEILFHSDDSPACRIHSGEIIAKRNQPRTSYDAKSEAADESTQTDGKRRIHRLVSENEIAELDGSPPPVDSSPETLESLMKADKRVMVTSGNTNEDVQSGRLKASSVLMQMITCGSFSFRDCGATAVKDHGLSLISQHKGRMIPHAVGDEESHVEKDEEYFSGSVIENTPRCGIK